LWSIAVRHNLTWQALAAANGMNESDILVAGRTLALPGQAAAAPPVAAATAQPALTSTTPTTTSLPVSSAPVVTAVATPATPATRVHVVANGDTIISIASAYNLEWRQLLQLNGLNETSILQVGQQLRLE
jgi:membrane-bound lytic murein transglycosylase D